MVLFLFVQRSSWSKFLVSALLECVQEEKLQVLTSFLQLEHVSPCTSASNICLCAEGVSECQNSSIKMQLSTSLQVYSTGLYVTIYSITSIFYRTVCNYLQHYKYILQDCMQLSTALQVYSTGLYVTIYSITSIFYRTVCNYLHHFTSIFYRTVCNYLQHYKYILQDCMQLSTALQVYSTGLYVTIYSITSIFYRTVCNYLQHYKYILQDCM